MPELPEVETVVRSLRPLIINQRINSVHIKWPRVTSGITDFSEQVTDQSVQEINRWGKYILIYLDRLIITVHLRMTGKLLVHESDPINVKHISAWFSLSNGQSIIFKDVRKFGRFGLIKDRMELAEKLGVDPVGSGFTPKTFREIMHSRKRQVKGLLLDQGIIAGLGNIYIDEVLWECGIHPQKLSYNIKEGKCDQIHGSIVDLLRTAIKYGGTTIKDFGYQNGGVGEFRSKLKVYGQKDKPCERCGTSIERIIAAGRATWICSNCQKNPS